MEKDKIEVGEYIRTKKKGIFKVLSIRKTPYGYYCGTVDNANIRTFTIGKGGNAEIKNDILKHSKNIIDLIEVGDYVNGGKVVEHAHEKGRLFVSCTYVGGKVFTTFEDYSWELTKDKEENIETIVTKEQMKEMEYRV